MFPARELNTSQNRGEAPPPHLGQRVQHQRQLGGLPVALQSFGLQLHPLGFCHPDGLDHKGLRFSQLADLFRLCLSHEDLPHPAEGKPSPPAAGTPAALTRLPSLPQRRVSPPEAASALCRGQNWTL